VPQHPDKKKLDEAMAEKIAMENTLPLEDVEIPISPADLTKMALAKAVAKKVVKNTAIKTGKDLFKKEPVTGKVKTESDFATLRPHERPLLDKILSDVLRKGK